MEDLLANPATTVVDVRETGEFAGGHYEGAINIPLGIILSRLLLITKLCSSSHPKPVN